MSTIRRARRDPRRSARAAGQSLTEFTLVVPILLVILLTVADFGRLFATSITVESATRAAAELAASEYLREMTGLPLGSNLSPEGYDRVHQYAWSTVCGEAASLPNATPNPGAQCDGLPTVVCVHDGIDPACSSVYNASGGIPAGCPDLDAGVRPNNGQTNGGESRYVEVRVCYRFTTFFNLVLPFIGGSLSPLGGDYYVERTRTFTVADY